jgi:hypothetical protein
MGVIPRRDAVLARQLLGPPRRVAAQAVRVQRYERYKSSIQSRLELRVS